MTTVAQLIEYLQTLPSETTVSVVVEHTGQWDGVYTSVEDLVLPSRCSDGTFRDYSENAEFFNISEPWIILGQQ